MIFGWPFQRIVFQIDRSSLWAAGMAAKSRRSAATGRRVHATGRRDHTTGRRVHATGRRVHATGRRVHATGRRVHTTGRRVHATGRRVHATGRRLHRRVTAALNSGDLPEVARKLCFKWFIEGGIVHRGWKVVSHDQKHQLHFSLMPTGRQRFEWRLCRFLGFPLHWF